MNRILFLINCGVLVFLIVGTTRHHTPVVPELTQQTTAPFNPFGRLQAAQPGIQVNSLPAPFNINGTMPYQVWVNGERLPLKSQQADKIVELLDLGEFQQPADTAELHGGAGWITPLPITQ